MKHKHAALIDKKIGSVIRRQRVNLGITQSRLGEALGLSFQQIQKYENGSNAVASTRIPELCRILEISPNDLFGVSDSIDGEVLRLGPWALKTARKLQGLPPPMRQSVETLLDALAQPERCQRR
jgi:transcriptional regulator with XRE-family HTH domain